MNKKSLCLLSLLLATPGAFATVLIGKAAAHAPAGKGPVYWDLGAFSFKGNKLTPKLDHRVRVGFHHPERCDGISISWRSLDGLAVSKAPSFRGSCEELADKKDAFTMDISIPSGKRGLLVADVTVVQGDKRRSTSLVLPFEATDYHFTPKPITVDKFGNRFQDEKIN